MQFLASPQLFCDSSGFAPTKVTLVPQIYDSDAKVRIWRNERALCRDNFRFVAATTTVRGPNSKIRFVAATTNGKRSQFQNSRNSAARTPRGLKLSCCASKDYERAQVFDAETFGTTSVKTDVKPGHRPTDRRNFRSHNEGEGIHRTYVS